MGRALHCIVICNFSLIFRCTDIFDCMSVEDALTGEKQRVTVKHPPALGAHASSDESADEGPPQDSSPDTTTDSDESTDPE